MAKKIFMDSSGVMKDANGNVIQLNKDFNEQQLKINQQTDKDSKAKALVNIIKANQHQ